MQIVIAGKSHPADDGGKQLIAQMVRFADDPAVRHRITFLPDYDIGMARYLYWGVDVWLNNPLRPLEACGTSGMKAALNGALNLSIMDGWWDEWFDGDNGWAIPSADGIADPDRRDDLEAHALYDLIEKNVATRFYDRGADDVPTRWVQMVRHTLKSLGPEGAGHPDGRRVRAPALRAGRRVVGPDGGRRLRRRPRAGGLGRRRSTEPGPRSRSCTSSRQLSGTGDAQVGDSLTLRAEVALGGLTADDVDVEAVYGGVDAEDRLTDIAHGLAARGRARSTARAASRARCRSGAPAGSATPCACCRRTTCW